MKKLFVLLFAFVLCFAGCSGEKEFIPERGKVENVIYENSAFGISFEADDNWYYFTDEEIAQNMGVAADELFSEDFAANLENIEMIYDMYCANLTTGSTVNVNYENIGLVYGGSLDEKTYLEMSKAQLEGQLEGITVSRNEIGTTKIFGKEVPCLFVELEFSGIKIYETIVVKKTENWVGVVTCASLSEEELPILLEKISFE